MLITVGRIGRAHGVRGEVAVHLTTDEPETRFADGAVLTTEPATAGPLTVVRSRWHSGRLLVVFDRLTDRTVAENLRGTALLADVDEHERPADPEEFYDRQLVGLRVVTTDGQDVGTVREVVHLPGQDLLEVAADAGGQPVLVPFVATVVPEIDLPGQRLVIDPPPGLLELNDAQDDTSVGS